MKFLNEKRIRDYPRLFLIALWGMMLINVIFHRGWVGRFGGIIGVDFLCLYASGWQYRTAIEDLYNLEAQARLQQELIYPTPLYNTVNIFPYPPYAALAFSIFSWLSYKASLITYSMISILAACLAVFLIHRHLLGESLIPKVSAVQLGVVLFSSLPFILCIFFGQNSNLTLLILTLTTIASIRQKWLIAGLISGLLLYKPHFVLGFLIVWLAWKRLDALIGFAVVAGVWIGGVLTRYGLEPFKAYINFLPVLVQFPYVEGIRWGVTPLAFFSTLAPPVYAETIHIVSLIFTIVLALFLWHTARDFRPSIEEQHISALIMASFVPFLVSPHILIYDLVQLVIPLALWSRLWPSLKLLTLAVFAYLGPLILLSMTRLIPIHLLALIPMVLAGCFFHNWFIQRSEKSNSISESTI